MSMSEWLEDDSMELDEADINHNPTSICLRLTEDDAQSQAEPNDPTFRHYTDGDNSLFLRHARTQSMDDDKTKNQHQHQHFRSTAAAQTRSSLAMRSIPHHEKVDAMNASFDMSMLHQHQPANQHPLHPSPGGGGAITRTNAEHPPMLRVATSWDEHESSSTKKRSNKHHRAHFAVDMPELPPHSVSKKKRETPVRLRFRPSTGNSISNVTKNKGKMTPASAKRHRLRTRSSPLPRLPTTSRAEAAASASAAARAPDCYEPATIAKRKPKRSLGTCTTAASSTLEEETTMDNSTDNSVDTQDTVTNFRFTSFPASLPRIHSSNPGTSSACPNTVRKRMSFGSATAAAAAHSNDSHNTSVSSLQQDFGYSDDDDQDEEDDDHDDESTVQSSLHGTPRTRLNFNSLASSPLAMESRLLADDGQAGEELDMEDDRVDLSRPYEQQRMNSFASSVSSITKNLSGWGDENYTASTAAMTPSRGGMAEATIHPAPETPHEVQLHFQLDAAQCSPIPGIPEEEGDSSTKSGSFPRKPRLRLSTSHGSASTSGSGSGRPMPDMNAFDGNNNDTSRSSSSTRSADDAPPSPKLLCPPTPVRIHPIFRAGGGQKLARSNSLIATKVLATCSPQVLDGRASLENSVLEEGKSDSLSSGADGDVDGPNTATVFGMKHSGSNTTDWFHHARSPSMQGVDVPGVATAAAATAAAVGSVVSMASTFDVISTLGSGTFADVYKVKSKVDGRMYAIKRNRRQFRGRRDREAALSEVRSMQRLQSQVASFSKESSDKANYSLYLLFFFQAWQEDGHFFCQTELCCRDTCREMMDALRSQWNVAKTRYPSLRRLPAPDGVKAGSESDVEGRLIPEAVIWKVCHDIGAGLSFIHSHGVGLVHNDIKPSNILFVKHSRFGALGKIGDFGMARSIGSSEDGQEGDQKYMAPEMLESGTSFPTADIFSLGLTLYEMASNLYFTVPSDGSRWHELRSGRHALEFPADRSAELFQLIRLMIDPDREKRPLADAVVSTPSASAAGKAHNNFLRDYIHDVEECDSREDEMADGRHLEQTPRNAPRPLCSPPAKLPAPPMLLFSPEAAPS